MAMTSRDIQEEPRILPLPESDWSQEMRDLLARGTPDGEPRRAEYFTTLVRHPRLYRHMTAYASTLLLRGLLPARVRELAILRNAWLCAGALEWGEHVAIAKELGFTGQDFDQVITGPDHPRWTAEDQCVLRAVDELHADGTIGDATWAALKLRLDDTQLIELIQLVGMYATTAWLQNSLRIRLRAGNAGLEAR
jgi:alkylhydroperoxidase family enzyme